MSIRLSSTSAAVAVTLAIALSGFASAQELTKQDPAPRGRTQRPTQRVPVEEIQNTEQAQTAPTLEETLPRIMDDLAKQIANLTVELRLLRKETERNGSALELMIYEERLSKVESKLDDMNALKSQLEARDHELQLRARNIQQELVLRGGQFLRRDQAEAAIRADIQRLTDDTRVQMETTQQRLTTLQTQAESLRRRIEVLRKKVEQLENRTEPQNQ